MEGSGGLPIGKPIGRPRCLQSLDSPTERIVGSEVGSAEGPIRPDPIRSDPTRSGPVRDISIGFWQSRFQPEAGLPRQQKIISIKELNSA